MSFVSSCRICSPTRSGRFEAKKNSQLPTPQGVRISAERLDPSSSWSWELGVDGRVSNGSRDPFDHEGFDHIADLDVVVLLEADAALEPGLDLRHVVLEAPER